MPPEEGRHEPVSPFSSTNIDRLSASPHRKRIRISYGDRYIPNRESVNLQAGFSLKPESSATDERVPTRSSENELDIQRIEEANRTFTEVLRSELFGDEVPSSEPGRTPPPVNTEYSSNGSVTPPRSHPSAPSTPSRNLFTFMSPSARRTPTRQINGATLDVENEAFSLSPVRFQSQKMLLSPRKQLRSISKVPFRVLDAPELADDFYLNLVDWSSSNILGVGLSRSVYLWNAASGGVSKLCQLPENDLVTSVAWLQEGKYLAVGSHRGIVQIWDAEAERKLRTMDGHSSRVGSLAWHGHILSSGSRDKSILLRDVRDPGSYFRRLTGHKQEICGLKWSCEDDKLASGGNDNKLFVWNSTSDTPLLKFTEHIAAVKAIAWSPHQRGILASGGGTADRRIKFWNTMTNRQINEIDTGSQICNLVWSKNSNEIVSAHGYSQNQIAIWKYPSMRQVTALTGHTCRVLYLAISPDGQTIVSGAGDETLRFWNVFGKGRPEYREVTLLDAVPQLR
ncbi:quinon protein alcohol dehydrogenase-like superfamily [Kockiozyma suomiensis]|uniref:quinon protein alcohol dehydrogenase-like superfamily n=1 Tax=Kockiozyma suomiensis TaxID=1337062 RepID=UPI00334377ED